MATKIPTTELKVGMFVADLDRPCVDTPFLLQGFLIEDGEQIRALMKHCHFVMVDRTRSTGDEYEAPAAASVAAPSNEPGVRNVTVSVNAARPGAAPRDVDLPRDAQAAAKGEVRVRGASAPPPAARAAHVPREAAPAGEGLLGRI